MYEYFTQAHIVFFFVDLIGRGGYCKVKKDPTLKIERKLSQILSKNKDLIPQMK